jgi:hypothetical protein
MESFMIEEQFQVSKSRIGSGLFLSSQAHNPSRHLGPAVLAPQASDTPGTAGLPETEIATVGCCGLMVGRAKDTLMMRKTSSHLCLKKHVLTFGEN